MGSPIYRRTIHVTLGFTAFVCLTIAISFGKSPVKDKPLETSVEIPEVITLEKKVDPPLKVAELTKVVVPPKAARSNALAKTEFFPQIEEITPKPTPGLELEMVPEEKTTETLHVVKVQQGDTLGKIFDRLGISTKDIQDILNANPVSQKLASLKSGKTLKLRVTKDKEIAGLSLQVAPGSLLVVSRQPGQSAGFQVEQKIQPIEKQLAFGKGQIRNSLFSAAKRAGLDNKVVSQMVEIFGWNINFTLDLQPSDTFRVLYEEKCVDGQRIETGHILAAEIVNGGKKYQAVRYTDKTGHTGYFSPEGYGMHQAFLRSPITYASVSSKFGLRRHPVLHRLRQHKGVDYSAPSGTPVQATGHGKVVYIGRRGGYGNVVELQHGARYSTLYGHLSRFGKDKNGKILKVGAEVAQGQTIGYVGRTGLATGDHLHYEFRIAGIHHDPLTVALPKAPIPDTNKRHFIAHSKEMLRLLDFHDHKIKMALNDFFAYE